jgi:hypothetical protein
MTTTQNSLLAAALAIRAYRAERGRLPLSLEAIERAVGHRFMDYFAASGKLRYRRFTDNYVLYSIGPDGRDDKGRAVYLPGLYGNSDRSVQPNSLGDIVAGVNEREF